MLIIQRKVSTKMRWNNDEGNFDQILASNPNVVQLLSTNKFVEQVKDSSSKFTQKIIQQKYRHILYEFIDIALIPKIYMQSKQTLIDKSATHNAIQILSNLSQEFIQQIFDKHSGEQDLVIQTEKEYPILNHLFRILTYESAEETALAYFNKIVTPFIYHRSEDMIKIINTQFLSVMLNYFWNQSVSDILTKIIQAETQKDFFEKQKIELIKNICKFFEEETNEVRIQRNIKSLKHFIESLVQKHQDKYDKAKYAKIIKRILQENNFFAFLFKHAETYHNNHHIKVQILHCIEAFLRIHLNTSNQSKNQDSVENIDDSIKLNQSFEECLKHYLLNHKIEQYVSDSRVQLLSYYKLIKTSLIIQPKLVGEVVTHQFIAKTLQLMKKDINNNILHNFQRDILIRAIKQSEQVCHIFENDKEIGVQSLLSSKISDRNSKNCYENQIFLIAQALKSKGSQIKSEQWSNLSEIIDNKRKFYSVLIGGNAREDNEDKWQSMQNDQMILNTINHKDIEPSKQTIEEKPQKKAGERKIMIQAASSGLQDLGGAEVLSQEEDEAFNTDQLSNSKNKHFFDFQLPLDSDKEQNSLDDIPMTIRIDSVQDKDSSLRNSSKTLTKSNQGIKVSNQGLVKNEQENEHLPTVIEDPIEHTTQIVLEDQLKEQSIQIPPKEQEQPSSLQQQPPLTLPQFCRQQIESLLHSKYSLHLQQRVPHKQQIGTILQSKYDLAIK